MADANKSRQRRPKREEKEFEEYMLQMDRVTRVVKGGRRMRFRVTLIIGDRAGRVGLGIGKGNDVQIATQKASHDAKKNLIEVPIINETIPHSIDYKYKAARVRVLPAASGTGLIAGSAVRKILELAGVKNVLSKNYGTQNRVVLGQAVIKMLQNLRVTEASKKFTTELKKEKEAEKRARVAKRNLKDSPRRRHDNRPARNEKSNLKESAEKLNQEKGRLEKEVEKKK